MSISNLSNLVKNNPRELAIATIAGASFTATAFAVASFAAHYFTLYMYFAPPVLTAAITTLTLVGGIVITIATLYSFIRKKMPPMQIYQEIEKSVVEGKISAETGYDRLRKYDTDKTYNGIHNLHTPFTEGLEFLVTNKLMSKKNAYAAYQTYRIVRNDIELFHRTLDGMPWLGTQETLKMRQQTRTISNTVYATESAQLRKSTYMSIPKAISSQSPGHITQIWMEELTTGEMTRKLLSLGYNPAMLDMANGYEAGGGFLRGAMSQEEIEFEGCNGYEAVEEIRDRGGFPIPEHGVIVMPNVTFFRDARHNILQPAQATIIGSAAYMCFAGGDKPNDNRIYEEGTKEKMRGVMRAAILNGNDSLILSAFGCGAFVNDPKTIIRLYKEILAEPEFQGWFRAIVFAVINDHNGSGNAGIFREAFGERARAP